MEKRQADERQQSRRCADGDRQGSEQIDLREPTREAAAGVGAGEAPHEGLVSTRERRMRGGAPEVL